VRQTAVTEDQELRRVRMRKVVHGFGGDMLLPPFAAFLPRVALGTFFVILARLCFAVSSASVG
jgi:hypothetical protein